MLNKNVIKNTVFGIGGLALSIYALRSYGYQKEWETMASMDLFRLLRMLMRKCSRE